MISSYIAYITVYRCSKLHQLSFLSQHICGANMSDPIVWSAFTFQAWNGGRFAMQVLR